MNVIATSPTRAAQRILAGAMVWMVSWGAMLVLDGQVDLANLAMVLVLAAAIATLWLPIILSLALSALSVLAFNWLFVPPRHAFTIDLRDDALLLGAMLLVSWIIAGVVSRQRLLAESAGRHARRAEQLRRLGETLREADDPAQIAASLRNVLTELLGAPPHVLVLRGGLPESNDAEAIDVFGEPTADELAGLWHCTRQARPFGPGTDRYAEVPRWYLPLRGRQAACGAAVVTLDAGEPDDALRLQAQALCDQAGAQLQRAQSQRSAAAARAQAQDQGVRNALLAAISHDYRTPLAAILGAASALHDQAERLAPEQRRRLAQVVVDEATQLGRLTDNTLQLARLDAPGVRLHLDWESAQDIVGAVLRRARVHDSERRVRVRLEPELPLVRCDALLLSQLLENLIDNALRYSAAPAPVELLVRRQADHIVFAVRDRGPGVDPAWRERIFEVYQRGATSTRPTDGRRGAGVGLAVCRAIARAHGGELRLRNRAHGGASFECWLPEAAAPPIAMEAAASGVAGVTLRVLLVEDDRALRTMLRDALTVEGYEVYTAATLSEGMALLGGLGRARADAAGVDLVLLDLGLPDGDGEALLTMLRKRHATPLIVISATDADGRKIRLLDAGADDYLVKPFSLGELLARMRVGMRHRGTRLAAAVTHYAHGALRVDLAAHEVRLADTPVHLTPTEFKLLARLVRNAGQVVTHRQLLTDVWGADHVADTHYLRLYMAQLRAKLEADPTEPQLLLTEPGVGYRLADSPSETSPGALMRS